MLEKIENGFEDLVAIYCGFPLKPDWQQSGLEALKAYEEDLVQSPVLEDGKIRFTMAVSYYFTDEEVLDLAWDLDCEAETIEEAKKEIPQFAEAVHAENVTISVREENGKLIIGDVNVEICVLDHERKPFDDLEVLPDNVDEEYGLEMIEVFLDAAVDAS